MPTPRRPAPVPLHPADRSVRVHDCHSPRRELEALRDALLDAFAEVPGLRPSDVLVLVPDLATYAPLVDAVFEAESATGGAAHQAVRLPVHVVNHPDAPALRVVEAFRKALRMHDGRVTASELLDLLGYPIVRQAAGIAEDELPPAPVVGPRGRRVLGAHRRAARAVRAPGRRPPHVALRARPASFGW